MVRPGQPRDLEFIDDLRRKESESVGFIPKDVYRSILECSELHPGRLRWRYQAIWIAEDNGDRTGFCYCSYSGSWAHIFQIAVRDDARRLHRAMLMAGVVEDEAVVLGKAGISCRVATDIEANRFWLAAGYTPVKEVKGGLARGRILRVYTKPFASLFDIREQPPSTLVEGLLMEEER